MQSLSPQRPHPLIQAEGQEDEEPLECVDDDVDVRENHVVYGLGCERENPRDPEQQNELRGKTSANIKE